MPATTVVLFGATGDLARRKLLPGMLHLHESQLLEGLRIVATSLDELSREEFLDLVLASVREHSSHNVSDDDLREFADRIHWVPGSAGPQGIRAAVDESEAILGPDARRLHYLSVPPKAALAVVHQLAEAGLVERSRIIMEKPFGTDLESARKLNAELHEVFDEEQIFRIDHFLGKEAAQNILAFRFANGLFEPIWHRNHIDHIQIDVPETLGLAQRADFYESTGAYRDMVVTHLFQVLAFTAMEPPTALEPHAISEEKNKVFRSMSPIEPHDVVRGQYVGYRDVPGVRHDSQTETFVALKCFVDNWRWAGVPFYLRTGKCMAESRQTVSLAFREPPLRMFRLARGQRASQRPNELTIEFRDPGSISQRFLTKQPGPGIDLNEAAMTFRYDDSRESGLLEAYERLLYDAMHGDQMLFTDAAGIERLWQVSTPLLENPPRLHPYPKGSWGPAAAQRLIAPRSWCLPEDE